MNTKYAVALLVLAGCTIGDPYDAYYEGTGAGPAINGLDVTSEEGNIGGGTVVISGADFGEDPSQVLVQFGSQNATVLSGDDASLQVQVPVGPIQGGAVDVIVANTDGYAVLDDGYTYDVGDTTQSQSAYITLSNNFESCYGGASSEVATGCESIAYTGLTGTAARAEFLVNQFPRFHSDKLGFYGGTDVSPGEWRVEIPGDTYYPQDIEDLRQSVGDITITNPITQGQPFCVDLAYLGDVSFPDSVLEGFDDDGNPTYYPGGSVSFGIDQLAVEGDCAAEDAREYDLGVLNLCEIPYYAESNHEYEGEWPIAQNFFIAEGNFGGYTAYEPVQVYVDVPEVGIDDVAVTLPEYVRTEAISGFDAGSPWWNQSFPTCLDADGDGSATLDEEAIVFEWVPTEVDVTDQVTEGGPIVAAETYMEVTLTQFRVGWGFGEGFPVRATIRVPDDHNYDAKTGRSSVSIPNWVIYQFPSINFSAGPSSQVGQVNWADPQGKNGYLNLELKRVSEFALSTSNQPGDVVVAYSTGDYTFYSWNHPLENGVCGDCIDQDGDGWTDLDDPDCLTDGDESQGAFGQYTCNDGIDNDGDDLIDAEDDDCGDGRDSETNCDDGVDNDGDGYTDEADGECVVPGFGVELGEDLPWWECSNGLDDDKDGWVDADDLGCVDGASPEGDGFLKDFACNNGLDDDGHGDIDAADPYCWVYGPDTESETHEWGSNACSDGKDNDADGYVDANDPECEYSPFNTEGDGFDDPAVRPKTKQCYDGIDNDGDALVDANDPGCWNDKAEPDGHLDDEASDLF